VILPAEFLGLEASESQQWRGARVPKRKALGKKEKDQQG
jgi:hypothetical protein